MRRDYGSRLFELLDSPTNSETIADITAAAAEALSKWEPRIHLNRVKLSSVSAGSLALDISGVLAQDGAPVLLEGITIA